MSSPGFFLHFLWTPCTYTPTCIMYINCAYHLRRKNLVVNTAVDGFFSCNCFPITTSRNYDKWSWNSCLKSYVIEINISQDIDELIIKVPFMQWCVYSIFSLTVRKNRIAWVLLERWFFSTYFIVDTFNLKLVVSITT